jgi:hypothetical protein
MRVGVRVGAGVVGIGVGGISVADKPGVGDSSPVETAPQLPARRIIKNEMIKRNFFIGFSLKRGGHDPLLL